jgi:sulfatase maturation enzyme AslB (radical SAM superfamily)
MEERLYMGLGYERQFGQWYAECMKYIDPEKHITDRAALNVTMVVTKACNFACSYCYQHGKKPERMSATTAREIVDFLLSDRINNYVEPEKTPCVILDFIGGEPLLEIDIIDEFMIISYTRHSA